MNYKVLILNSMKFSNLIYQFKLDVQNDINKEDALSKLEKILETLKRLFKTINPKKPYNMFPELVINKEDKYRDDILKYNDELIKNSEEFSLLSYQFKLDVLNDRAEKKDLLSQLEEITRIFKAILKIVDPLYPLKNYSENIIDFVLIKAENYTKNIINGGIIDIISGAKDEVAGKSSGENGEKEYRLGIKIETKCKNKSGAERKLLRHSIESFTCHNNFEGSILTIFPSIIFTEIHIDRNTSEIFDYDYYICDHEEAFGKGFIKSHLLADIKNWYKKYKFWGYSVTDISKERILGEEYSEEALLFSEGVLSQEDLGKLPFKNFLRTKIYPFDNKLTKAIIRAEIKKNQEGKFTIQENDILCYEDGLLVNRKDKCLVNFKSSKDSLVNVQL